jgi:hypothetical protein
MLFAGRNPLTVTQLPPQNSPPDLENGATIDFFLRQAPAGSVGIEVTALNGSGRYTAETQGRAGINRFIWKLRFDPPTAAAGTTDEADADADADPPAGSRQRRGAAAGPGTYRVKLSVDGRTAEGTIQVRGDPAGPDS